MALSDGALAKVQELGGLPSYRFYYDPVGRF